VQETRHQFREDLKVLERQAMGGLDLVVSQLDRSLEALTYQDVELSAMVVADDDRIDGRYLEVHQGILSTLARQAPVAGDLRIVAALLHIIRCVERMGDQCVNIAKLVPLSGYEAPKDKEILEIIDNIPAVKALINITGDGLLNLPRVDAKVGFMIDDLPPVPPIFRLIQRYGEVSSAEMHQVYNMGIGFCVLVGEEDRDAMFAFSDLPTKLLPPGIAVHKRRIRPLGMDEGDIGIAVAVKETDGFEVGFEAV